MEIAKILLFNSIILLVIKYIPPQPYSISYTPPVNSIFCIILKVFFVIFMIFTIFWEETIRSPLDICIIFVIHLLN